MLSYFLLIVNFTTEVQIFFLGDKYFNLDNGR